MDDSIIDEIGIVDNFEGPPISPAEMGLKESDVGGGDTSKDKREQFPEVKVWSFAEAEAGQKGFGRDFVIHALNRSLIGPTGETTPSVKIYFDESAPDQAEISTSKSPKEIASLHQEITDLISSNLRIGTANLSEDTKTYLKIQKDQYVRRLQQRSVNVESVLDQELAGQRPEELVSVFNLGGLGIPASNGSKVDITEFGGEKISGVRSNIRIQSEISGQFVHWETDNVTRAKLTGQDIELDKRIYLNPQTAELAGTFSSLMKTFNEMGISVQGKMLDRSYELTRQIKSSSPKPVRADSIVLSFGGNDADRVLGTVLALYQENPSIFADRATPKIPFKIAPGIAAGAEPKQVGESLTSNRSKIIESTLSKSRQLLGISNGETIPSGSEDRAIQIFNSTFTETATANGVNPINLAFNTP